MYYHYIKKHHLVLTNNTAWCYNKITFFDTSDIRAYVLVYKLWRIYNYRLSFGGYGMRVCPYCHTNNFDVDTNCKKCNYPLKTSISETVVIHPQSVSKESNPTFYVKPIGPNSLQSITRVLMILGCIINGIILLTMAVLWLAFLFIEGLGIYSIACLITLFIFLPFFVLHIYMTGSYSHKIANSIKVSIAFKIVTLLLFSPICGILMLCDND